jgi:membrane dipeptidase
MSEKPDFTVPNTEKGLTAFGIEVVKRMEQLGMIVDVSHLSDKGFWDVFNNTTKPFIASHSNSRNVCNHVRNLTDDMIKALSSRGGVVGLNFCTNFINEEASVTYVDDIVKHALHIIDVGGIECLALGTDFDGIGRTTEIDNASEMYKLYEEFKNVGLSDNDIEKIFYKNFLRVFKEVCG